ncbi:MAG: hypothetical protein JST59_16570 [Actinobacteria bacterium]|jgi:hypothetical protein|nr:hypothetical protein [Actinomycetota bacterium]
MPLEGHYERQTTPLYKLSSREIRVAVGIVAVTLVTIVAMVAFAGASNSNPAPAKGCINPTVAGIVGAETLNACGQEAVDICTHASEYTGARAETIVGNCEKQAVKF